MPDYTAQYCELYERFGYPLGKSHGVSPGVLDKHAYRLDHEIPIALRDYYAVAGGERRFNCSLQRFLHPSKWFVDQWQLVFLEENQSVCWWGVSLKSCGAKDPMISQGVREEDSIEWYKEHPKCSSFIQVLLHYQAVSGGFRYCDSAESPGDAHDRLKQDGWNYVGEVNQLWAFSRPNQAVCFMSGGGLPSMPAIIARAGGKTQNDLDAISRSLGVKFE